MKRRPRKRRRSSATGESGYTCPTCGERIIIPLDPSAGNEQSYVEDCPVCCHPNVIHVEFFGPGEPPRIWAEAE
jgi:Cysteine-rich CPXCG